MHFEAFIDQQLEAAKKNPRPVRTRVELTYGCNLRCVHCYNPTHQAKNELGTDEVKRVLRELMEAGCLWVSFTGGELFSRRDVCELVQFAQDLGLVVTLVTNATLVTPTLADQLRGLQPYQIEISIYGATASVYEAVTGVRGSFAKFVRGVDLLIDRGLEIMIKPVLMTLNVHEQEAMIHFAASRGVRFRVCTEIHPRVNGDPAPLAYRLAPDQQFEIWKSLSGEAIRRQSPLDGAAGGIEKGCATAGALFDCLCGKSGACVTPYGEMNLCTSISFPRYDVRQGSVAEGWKTLVQTVAGVSAGPAYECGTCNVSALLCFL